MANINVLIVDDSLVFRSQIKAALTNVPGITVVGSASNGKIALEKLSTLKVDLMTLDLEMAEMNGLETLAELKKRGLKTKVIIFSSRTQSGADAAIVALQAGAADVVAKPTGENPSFEAAFLHIQSELVPKVKQFLPTENAVSSQTESVQSEKSKTESINLSLTEKKKPIGYPKTDIDSFKPSVILIGCSTGGPDALDKLFQNFPRPLDIPIIIVQHMPPVFTASLARRIQNLTGIPCAEGQQWEIVSPNRIYIAPGDFHMTLTQNDSQVRIRLDQGPKVQGVRPAVDNLFLSAVKIYGASCLGVVLTGMGEDGLQGAHAIKKAGGGLLIQSAESCVVFGMPGAIFKTGIHDKILDLAGIKRMIEAKTKKEGPAVNKVEAA